jgi:hypothetical protein
MELKKSKDQFFQGDFLSGVMSRFFKTPLDFGVLLRLIALLIFFAEIDRDLDLNFYFSLKSTIICLGVLFYF